MENFWPVYLIITGCLFGFLIMILNQNVPTVFAMSLGKAAGIIVDAKVGQNHIEYTEKVERLKAFQQMAITVPFEECIIAFHGIDLDPEQKEVLKIIYKSTRPWMLGHVVGVLLNKLDSNLANKDFAEAIRTIIEQLTKDGTNGDGPSAKLKGMLVTYTTEAA